MRALTPAGPTASRAGAVTPITGRAATAPGLPYRHNLISANGTDRSDRWVTSGSGALSAHLREQIALTVGQANECGYCIAAHSAIGQKVGLSVAELAQARHGLAADHKGTEALSFARKLVDQRGRVTDADVDHVCRAGYSDGELNAIVANVAMKWEARR